LNNTVRKIFYSLFCLAISFSLLANTGNNFLNKGNSAYLKGKLDDAMKLYARADKSCIDEKDKIENNKALVFAQKGKLKLALQRLSSALEINPNNANAYYNRGLINIQSDNYSQAAEDFENAKYLGVADVSALEYNLALSYFLDDQIELAKTQLNVVELIDNPQATYLQGLIAYHQKDFEQASISFQNSLALYDHPDVKFAQALATYYAGNTNKGLAALEQLKKEKSLREKIQTIYAHLALEANNVSNSSLRKNSQQG